MAHVNYPEWASYIHELLETHGVPGDRLVELGCGTGSIGLALCDMHPYEYAGVDLAEPMLRQARRKAEALGHNCSWIEADYRDFSIEQPVHAVLLLYDGLNYALEESDLVQLFARVSDVLVDGGLFLVDQSTPANSENNSHEFEDQGGDDRFGYIRSSSYDPDSRIHTTVFQIEHMGTVYQEPHRQRAYRADEVEPLLRHAGLDVVASYDGFTTKPVSGASERIQWVARKVS